MQKRSQAQEQTIARDIGGRTQPGSGNQSHAKGDVRFKGKHRVEAKFTYGKSYRVDLSDLQKIRSEVVYPEKPAFIVDFIDKMTGVAQDQWALIPYADWLEYVNASSNNR